MCGVEERKCQTCNKWDQELVRALQNLSPVVQRILGACWRCLPGRIDEDDVPCPGDELKGGMKSDGVMKTGKDDAEVGTPPPHPAPRTPRFVPPRTALKCAAHPRRLFTSVGGRGLGGVAGIKNPFQGGAGGRRRDRTRDGPWCERHQQRDVEPPRAAELGQR